MATTHQATRKAVDRDGLPSPFMALHHVAVVTNDMKKTVAFIETYSAQKWRWAIASTVQAMNGTLHHRRAEHRLRLLRVPGRRNAHL
jgi:hypothetical protein